MPHPLGERSIPADLSISIDDESDNACRLVDRADTERSVRWIHCSVSQGDS